MKNYTKSFYQLFGYSVYTADEWEEIKTNKPEAAEQELDVFSDLVWYGVLSKVEFLEHISPNQIHLFKCGAKDMHLIALKLKENKADFTTKEGFQWLRDNLLSDDIEFL